MTRPTQPLRDEHQELLPHIEHLRQLADAVGETPPAALVQNVAAVHDFLAHHLIPHAHAEDRALYPVVARLLGAPEATATMSRDHVEVGSLTAELAELRGRLAGGAADGGTAKALRRVLYGLYALVKVHFAKEEEIYLPLLDARLSAAEAQAMFAQMEAAAAELHGGQAAHDHGHH
jgi:hemerythrin-like domain-containing protein